MFSVLQKVKSTEDGPLGPGSDLLAALLGTFVLLAVSEREGLGVRPNQMKMIYEVATAFEAKMDSVNNQYGSEYHLFGGKVGRDTIKIQNDAKIQHFYFGSNILFEPRESVLKPGGREAVKALGKTIQSYLPFFDEIHIQGHADRDNTEEFNLELAAKRAMSVFWIFKDTCRINPNENLMSVTSFGEYKPVDRKNQEWNVSKTNKANDSPFNKNKNRRIEIILFYKATTGSSK